MVSSMSYAEFNMELVWFHIVGWLSFPIMLKTLYYFFNLLTGVDSLLEFEFRHTGWEGVGFVYECYPIGWLDG